jgi:hypothetical protein
MALYDAATVLARQWSLVLAELDDTVAARLRALREQLDTAMDSEVSGIWLSIVDLATQELSTASVVRRELNRALGFPRFKAGTAEWRELTPATTKVRPLVDAWILAAAADTPKTVRRRGVDPDLLGLIRLNRPDGRVSLPAFQFTRAGEPKPLVLRINQVLGADTDPWGAADWWLCPNTWLAGTPADLLGTLDDHVLVAAAVAAVEG